MSDRSSWHLIARLAVAETLVPVGVAAAAGIAVSSIITPHWRAVGLPYLLGYGKNVEFAAVAAALVAGASTQLFAASRRGLYACLLVAALGFALVAARCPILPLLGGWPQLVAVAAIALALGAPASAGGGGAGAAGTGTRAGAGTNEGEIAGALAAVLVAGLALAALAVTVGPPLLQIDVFHHGEVLATAIDLLHGGRPFETLLWPHGLHDTGLTALWIRATGKVGTSPVALAWASCCALGIVAVYAVAASVLRSRLAAVSACLAAGLAPLLLIGVRSGAAAEGLYQIGVLVFAVLGLAAVTSRRRLYLAAGVACGLAYLFRIETGVYSSLAALAVIAYRELAGADAGGGRSAAKAAWGGILRFAAGAALVVCGCRLIFGWPGAAWFGYTLGELPRYHRDASGVPLPWPHRGVELSASEAASLALLLARLLFTLLLLVQALRRVLEHRRGLPHLDSRRTAQLLFVALFAGLATKSGLDRSDMSHLGQWTALPLLAAVCLAAAAWSERRSWGARRAGLAVFGLIAILDLGSLGFRLPASRGPAAVCAAARQHWLGFVEHLRPNPPVGACADRMFTPGEAAGGLDRRFIDDTCAMEQLLRSHGVGRMVIADAAPWYDVRFQLPPASRYFALARAYTPARQRELIAMLRARPAQALLLPSGYNGIRDFDLPDALRVPVADAYLRGRREGVAATPTPVGDLFLWNEPPSCPPQVEQGGDGEKRIVDLSPQRISYQAASGLLFVRGWAFEAQARRPLAALRPRDLPPGVVGSLDYGLDWGGKVPNAAPPHSGWELVCRGWRAPLAGRRLALEAITADGHTARFQLDLSGARVLGPLLGSEWQGLAAAIDSAAALGRADRAAALGGATQPAGCKNGGAPEAGPSPGH